MITSIINFIIDNLGSAAVAVASAMFTRIGNGTLSDLDAMPGLDAMGDMFITVGIVIAVGLLYVSLTSSAASPILGNVSEHPLKAVIRFAAVILSVLVSKQFLNLLLSLTEKLFTVVMSYSTDTAAGTAPGIEELIKMLFADLIPAAGVASVLLHLILAVIMAWNVIKISLLTFEHYLLLLLGVHLSPIFFGTAGSAGTEDIFRSFIRSFFTQCAALIATACCFKAFILNLSMQTSRADFGIVDMLILIIFSTFVSSVDSVLARFGLSSLPSRGKNADGMAGFLHMTQHTAAKKIESVVSDPSASRPLAAASSALSSLGSRSPLARLASSEAVASRPGLRKALDFATLQNLGHSERRTSSQSAGTAGKETYPAESRGPTQTPRGASPVVSADISLTRPSLFPALGKNDTGQEPAVSEGPQKDNKENTDTAHRENTPPHTEDDASAEQKG